MPRKGHGMKMKCCGPECVFREMLVQSSFCGDSKHIQMLLLSSFAATSDVGGCQKHCANIFESQKELYRKAGNVRFPLADGLWQCNCTFQPKGLCFLPLNRISGPDKSATKIPSLPPTTPQIQRICEWILRSEVFHCQCLASVHRAFRHGFL